MSLKFPGSNESWSSQKLELGQKKFELARVASEHRKLERQSLGCSWERLVSLKQAIAQRQAEMKRLERAIARLEVEIGHPRPE